jgi:hypothetical protein
MGTEEASIPFKNSEDWEPVNDNNVLLGTGAMVGTVRMRLRSAAGIIVVVFT